MSYVTTQEELSIRLKQLGIRVTPQRLAIAEVVINSGDHPTVKEIYDRVKAFFPYVTLATVYSTLDLLERAAIVRELPFQRQSRYDANLSPHANLVCIGCGTVVDADVGQNMVAELRAILEKQAEFEVASQRVDFYGWCSGCAGNRSPEASVSSS
ncbi:MAG: transcriptional repressor [Chloroflexi bacterium]|nr:transcriptional repressor [Chloroflexota bacterium]MCI0781543.1 transcriptional repressor [Chloroflexota bacterium]MCI0786938.1 transcriptional repressor [Chloroflexota bacterium]MCI0824008.1 transcriptional repressor [Chloroflexota bacterium]MCI0858231.1 transcriptional repressor [Chloroflexota bacterium]